MRHHAPMRILVASAPGVGHLLPLLPLARAARDRGHEVLIAGGASLEPIVAAAGFTLAAMGPATIDEVARTIPGVREVSGRRRAVLVFRGAFCGVIAADMADGIQELSSTWRPDVMIREDMAFGAWVAADRETIPQVTVQTTAWRPRMRDLAGPPLNDLRVRHGLAADPELTGLLGRAFFTTRPPSLRDPGAPFPAGTMELRPIADDRHAGADGADAADPFPPADGRPRVAVTLGTVNAGETEVLRALMDGAVAAGAHVVVALGADPATLGPVPPGVVVEAYVPMSALIPAADLVAFHGGSGTMIAALAAARPMVIVPLAADQPDNADRCAAAGVARVVALEDLSVEGVRAAVEAVATDPAYRRRAAAVAAEIEAMPGPEVAVEWLEALTG
jgi:UDP:flavonoid glycosyltransferase YjiC (YdhE family)